MTAIFLQKAGTFIYLILGLVLLFPLSTDPLRKIPRSRLSLWPLEKGEHRLLRLLSPWVNPVTWLIAGLAVWMARGSVSVGLWAIVAGVIGVGFVLSEIPAPAHGLLRRVPQFPSPLNHLIRKNLREMFATLDFYCGLLLSLAALLYRLLGRTLPPEALLPLTVLLVLAFSSYAQCLFGLDGAGGMGRYRLLPLPGWQILAAKDAAFLLVVVPLTLPLAPVPGLSAALVALALGHGPSVAEYRAQTRWRFSSGASVIYGVIQSALMAMAAVNDWRLTLPLSLLAFSISLLYYGRRFQA
ncbi:MAG TPA: hypothetical protein VG456_28830 [Candidatus Sulfopaludibacter sp.]|nr:hypothetical protein [Candidatus Sulfopaludibacter sp.]